jgi:hypothetical protein
VALDLLSRERAGARSDPAVAGIRQERQLSEDELPYRTIDMNVSGTSVRGPPICDYFPKAGGVFQKNGE